MTQPKLFMESTEVSADKTAAEIQIALVAAGANKIMNEYAGGQVVGLTFSIVIDGNDVPFSLPVRTEPVFKIINGRRKWASDRNANAAKDREQARRVAWRQLYRWVQAQVALIQTGMVKTQEVFMPYLRTSTGQTVYELAEQRGFKLMLPAPEAQQ